MYETVEVSDGRSCKATSSSASDRRAWNCFAEARNARELVLREYRPDYGLDYAVEVFEDAGTSYPQTLGEHFFIQLKSTESPKTGSLRLHRRGNVEKGREELDDEPSMSIDTYSLSLETSELVTVERMGVGLPVLLVIADLTRERCIFVCLNDYIDKILVPRFDDYRDAEYRTVHLPCSNDVSATVGRIALRWYAKRSKLFSAFQRFTFQYLGTEMG